MLIDEAMARKIKFETRELPPKDIKGSVTPTTGINPIFMPILMRNCSAKKKKQLMRKVFSKELLLFLKIV